MSEDCAFKGPIEQVAAMRQYRSGKQRWTGIQILFKSGRIKRKKKGDVKLTKAQQEALDEQNSFAKIKHLHDDQKHLRSLLRDPNVSANKRFDFKEVLEDALHFLNAREQFWASQ